MGWPRTGSFPEPTPWNGSEPDPHPEGRDEDACTSPTGHSWVCTGTAYGGDDERWHGEGRCYCEHCGADGDA